MLQSNQQTNQQTKATDMHSQSPQSHKRVRARGMLGVQGEQARMLVSQGSRGLLPFQIDNLLLSRREFRIRLHLPSGGELRHQWELTNDLGGELMGS